MQCFPPMLSENQISHFSTRYWHQIKAKTIAIRQLIIKRVLFETTRVFPRRSKTGENSTDFQKISYVKLNSIARITLD